MRQIGGYFTQALKGLHDRYPDIIAEIRGKGLLIGIKLIAKEDLMPGDADGAGGWLRSRRPGGAAPCRPRTCARRWFPGLRSAAPG